MANLGRVPTGSAVQAGIGSVAELRLPIAMSEPDRATAASAMCLRTGLRSGSERLAAKARASWTVPAMPGETGCSDDTASSGSTLRASNELTGPAVAMKAKIAGQPKVKCSAG